MNEYLDLTVIILTYNEEKHIGRCLDNVCDIANEIIVIDCFSTDRTKEICHSFDKVRFIEHHWPGNQSEQLNWALENVSINSKWLLRLDADEYMTEELKLEIFEKLPIIEEDVSAILLPLGRVFHGKELKHGISNGIKMIRLFRKDAVRCEQRLMDEHLQVLKGRTIAFKNKFVDDSLISMTAFTAKHNDYSNREAALLLDAEYRLSQKDNLGDSRLATAIAVKRRQKEKYAKLPLYLRAFGYFIFRRYLKLGFLDGRAGLEWDFFQGLWYRMLIDAKVAEAHRICGNDREKIREYIENVLRVKL